MLKILSLEISGVFRRFWIKIPDYLEIKLAFFGHLAAFGVVENKRRDDGVVEFPQEVDDPAFFVAEDVAASADDRFFFVKRVFAKPRIYLGKSSEESACRIVAVN